MAAMCDVSATETAIIYGLEPVWGAGFAWFLLGERWGTTGWIGAALVLGKVNSAIIIELSITKYYLTISRCNAYDLTYLLSDYTSAARLLTSLYLSRIEYLRGYIGLQ